MTILLCYIYNAKVTEKYILSSIFIIVQISPKIISIKYMLLNISQHFLVKETWKQNQKREAFFNSIKLQDEHGLSFKKTLAGTSATNMVFFFMYHLSDPYARTCEVEV